MDINHEEIIKKIANIFVSENCTVAEAKGILQECSYYIENRSTVQNPKEDFDRKIHGEKPTTYQNGNVSRSTNPYTQVK